MFVNLIEPERMFTLTLPEKIKGQYWIRDIDKKGNRRSLLSIEGINNEWIAKSNNISCVCDNTGKTIGSMAVNSSSFFNVKIISDNVRALVFAEKADESRQLFSKIVVKKPAEFTIGRTNDNNFCYESALCSSHHAVLKYDGKQWSIKDSGSTNGTFVNNMRVSSQLLNAGDYIYIMGLKIVIGSNFFAVNNPDRCLKINSSAVQIYTAQRIDENAQPIELPEKDYFSRSPRFKREVNSRKFKIDTPPTPQKPDTVPMALMLGPSLTMGVTSMSTAVFTLNNVISNGGDITQAMPTMIMSASMLAGTVLWPLLTKKHEKKEKIANEKKRQDKYLAYLDEVRDEIKRTAKEQSDILNENLISPMECINRINEGSSKLWERVIGQNDFLKLRLGVGTLPLDAEFSFPEKKFTMDEDTLQNAALSLGAEPKELQDVPISVSLVAESVLGLYGENASVYNMLKNLILQMITLHSYDELKLILLTDEDNKSTWSFTKCIPHFWDNDKTTRFFAVTSEEAKELSSFIDRNILSREIDRNSDITSVTPYYVIIAAGKSVESCEAVKQLLARETSCGASIIFVAEELKDLPKESKLCINVNGVSSKMFDKSDTSGFATDFKVDFINEGVMDLLAVKLANTELDLTSQKYLMPNVLTFLEMFKVSKIEHLNILTRWKENNPTISLATPVGVDSYGGLFNLDLHEKYHGPHGLVAGMTGSGKSEFIITYILSLAVNYHPDEVAFILIDYKGGGLAGAFVDEERGIKLPHLAGTITNLDGAAVKRSLISIQSELRRRQAIFNEARKISNEGTMDIYKYQKLYREGVVSEAVPHLFIISDEFAELKSQQPEFMEQLISAARIGRSLGVHLILATQKPNGVVDDQIWSNSKFRVCLKVQDKADSQDMIKCSDAAEISQTGRFYLQVGFNELFALGQSAWCGAEYVPADTLEKSIDESISFIDNIGRVIADAKPGKKRNQSGTKIKQIVAIVKYLSDVAEDEKITVRPLWLKPIPAKIFVDELEEKYCTADSGLELEPTVGEYDDPFNQRQALLTLPITKDGNCIVYGATGNGKTTFLTTLCYSLIKNHTPEEVNIYLVDFGAETLKNFEAAPHVGGVVLGAEDEKITNLFKYLHKESERRKSIFSEYGGDHASYCSATGKKVPSIVVMINNFSVFAEAYENLLDDVNILTRDGVKYGIYFIVTAGATNAVRYKTAQNFKTILTMQLNDTSEYSVAVGKTEGLIPSPFKGRGLINIDRVYEFQTAFCTAEDDIGAFLRKYCATLADKYHIHAHKIPVLPDVVTKSFIMGFASEFTGLPVGVSKKTLNIASFDLSKRVVLPIVANDLYDMVSFVSGLVSVAGELNSIKVIDIRDALEYEGCITKDNLNEFVDNVFNEAVNRNNTFKDADGNIKAMDAFNETVYVLFGVKDIFDALDSDRKEKLALAIEKNESVYKMKFILVDAVSRFTSVNYEAWYKKHVNGAGGVWVGDGVADQYMLKINKVTSELYDEIGNEFGYVVSRGKPVLVKLITDAQEED